MIRAIKNTTIFSLLLGISFVLGLTPLNASNTVPSISLGRIAYSGSACPNGSVSASLNKNNATLHINFNQYVVEVHGRNQHSLRKTCDIALPIQVPKGVSVSLVSANYNGKVSLPAGSHARFMNAYSFSGRRGSRFKTDLHGPNSNGYSFRDSLSSFASVWSACGKNTTLRITTSTRIKTDGTAAKEAKGKTLADSRQGFITQLRYRSCQ